MIVDNELMGFWRFLRKNIDWVMFWELYLLSVGLLIRFYHVLIAHPLTDYLYSDTKNYFDAAERIMFGTQGYYNVFTQPGYSIFISFMSALTGDMYKGVVFVAIFQGFVSILAIYLLYRVAKKILSKNQALVYLLVMIIYFPLISYSGFLMTETVGFILVSFYFWVLMNQMSVRIKLYIFSVTSFLPLLFRPTLMLGILLCAAYLLWKEAKSKLLRNIKLWLVLVVGFLGSGMITVYLNFNISNKWILTPLNGGLNFAQGACFIKEYKDSNGWGFASPSHVQRNFEGTKYFDKPFYDSGHFYMAGIGCYFEKPRRLLYKLFEPYYLFFDNNAWPGSDNSKEKPVLSSSLLVFAFFVIPALILSFFQIKEKKNRSLFVKLWIFPLTLFVSTVMYYGDVRYRIPYDGIFILVAFWVFRLWRKMGI